jgi:hypothetical protein
VVVVVEPLHPSSQRLPDEAQQEEEVEAAIEPLLLQPEQPLVAVQVAAEAS